MVPFVKDSSEKKKKYYGLRFEGEDDININAINTINPFGNYLNNFDLTFGKENDYLGYMDRIPGCHTILNLNDYSILRIPNFLNTSFSSNQKQFIESLFSIFGKPILRDVQEDVFAIPYIRIMYNIKQ